MVLRILILISFVVIGAALGALIGTALVTPGDGLVGGAKVVMGMVIGGVLGLVAGGFAAWQSGPRMRFALGLATAPIAAVVIAFAVWSAWQARQAVTDPEEAYLDLPEYTLTLTRGPGADPALARQVVVDTSAKTWSSTLPDGRECEGTLRAAVQKRVGEALLRAMPLPDEADAACGAVSPERLQWDMKAPEISTGAAGLSQECIAVHPPLRAVADVVGMAPTLAESGTDCD